MEMMSFAPEEFFWEVQIGIHRKIHTLCTGKTQFPFLTQLELHSVKRNTGNIPIMNRKYKFGVLKDLAECILGKLSWEK